MQLEEPAPAPAVVFVADAEPVQVVAKSEATRIREAFERAFGINLDTKQRMLLGQIVQACDNYQVVDQRQIAYILATAWHESRLYCVKEKRARKGTALRRLQDRYWYTGFYGRGPSQLTWEVNYRKFTPVVNHNLVADPDAALRMDFGAIILVHGMAKGWFTGVELDDYFNKWETDWINARRIVNGVDRAGLIGRYGERIHDCMEPKF